MSSGDLTASSPVLCLNSGAVVTAVNALNLASGADFLEIVPANGLSFGYWVFKVERAA